MAIKLPPTPLGVPPGHSFWNDWYEKLRKLVENLQGTLLHNSLPDLQGGTTSQYYHLTSTEYSNLPAGAASSTDNEVPRFDGTSGKILQTSGVFVDDNSNLVLPKTTNTGIKVDVATPTFGWRDILGQIQTRGVGATDPDWGAIGGSVLSAYKFSINDVCWISYHIPHDYVPGSDWYVHVHWLPSGTDSNSVKWQIDWMYADGHNQQAFPVASLTSDTMEQTVGGTQYQHYITESDAQSGTSMEPDGIIYMKISRITNGGTDNANDIFVLQMDVHYQSTNMATKNRAPNFYS
jgi:hypothetical protein